jgi:hypothetical protein
MPRPLFSGGAVDPMSSVGTSKKMRRPHLCDICGKSYTQLPGLKYHMQSVHGMSDQVTLRPGTNVMIFKKFRRKIQQKNGGFDSKQS